MRIDRAGRPGQMRHEQARTSGAVPDERARAGVRGLARARGPVAGGLLLLATAILLTGCRAPAATPSPTPVPTPVPTPAPVVGQVGSPITLGSLVVIVRSAGEAPERYQTLGTEVRAVDIAVGIAAVGGPARLEIEQVQLVDESTGTRYAVAPGGYGGTITWPVILAAETAVDGVIAFTVPRGQPYILRIAAGPGLVAQIAIGSPTEGGTAVIPTPSPSPAVTPSPTATPTSAPTGGATYSAARAKAYQDTIFALYAVELPGYVASMKRASTASAADKVAKAAIATIDAHLAFLAATPAPACYQDAYSADRSLAALWKKAFGLRKRGDYGGAQTRSDRFVTELPGYFADCR